MILGRLRSVLLRVLAFGRAGIVLLAFLALANSGPTPEEAGHESDRLVAASHQQPSGACHRASHQCPAALEAAAFRDLSIAHAREDWLRSGGDPAPDEFLEPFDTPPPRA